MIVVISTPTDDHAACVLAELQQLDRPAALIDTAQFPQRLRLAMHYNGVPRGVFRLISNTGAELPLEDCHVVWWRRPQPYVVHSEIQRDTHRSFAYTEMHEALSGLWYCLDAFWVNHPSRDESAARKPYQLRVAQELGLRIPETLITNDPEQARAFVARRGPEKTIYKAFAATEQEWRETRVLRREEVALLDRVRFAPVIFQELVPAEVDLRITLFGGRTFAAAVHSQRTAYAVDYRMDLANAHVESHQLPSELEGRLHAYLERLGLKYGAVDMRLTPEGDYVFLEINTAGQFRFIEERTGQPITAEFSRFLAERDR